MALLDDNPTTFADDLAELVDEYLQATPIAELIEALAVELEGLRTEEVDHGRAVDAGPQADNQ